MSLKPPQNPTASVVVSRLDVPSGWYNVKDTYGATGNGTTDDTTAIQNAINACDTAGGGVVYFPPGTYKFTSLNLSSKNGLTLRGATGFNWYGNSSQAASKLRCSSTGSSRAVDLRTADGITFIDLDIAPDNNTYSGDFIDLGTTGSLPSSFVTFERCRIGLTNYTGARCMVRLDQAVFPIFRMCGIFGGQAGIRGYESGGTIAGNDGVFEDIVMAGSVVCIKNIGLNWRMNNITFEFTESATTHGISSDVTCSSVFEMTGCTFWDFLNTSQIAILQKSTNSWKARITGGSLEALGGASAAIPFQLLGSGTIEIDGTRFEAAVPAATASLIDVGTTVKDLVRIKGIRTTATSTLNVIAGLTVGHTKIDISENANVNTGGGAREVITLGGQERLAYIGGTSDHRPASATSAGQANIEYVGVSGNDLAGFVCAKTTAGGASNTGNLVDVTFAKSLLAGVGGSTNSGDRVMLVQLSPISGNLNSGNFSGTAGNNCGAYAVVSTTLTGFKVAITTAIPVSTAVAWAYRVTML